MNNASFGTKLLEPDFHCGEEPEGSSNPRRTPQTQSATGTGIPFDGIHLTHLQERRELHMRRHATLSEQTLSSLMNRTSHLSINEIAPIEQEAGLRYANDKAAALMNKPDEAPNWRKEIEAKKTYLRIGNSIHKSTKLNIITHRLLNLLDPVHALGVELESQAAKLTDAQRAERDDLAIDLCNRSKVFLRNNDLRRMPIKQAHDTALKFLDKAYSLEAKYPTDWDSRAFQYSKVTINDWNQVYVDVVRSMLRSSGFDCSTMEIDITTGLLKKNM